MKFFPVLTGFALLLLGVTSCKTIAINSVVKKYNSETGREFPGIAAAETLNGEPFALAGPSQKVRYVHVWSTTCSPCINGMPDLNALSKKMKEYEDVEIVNICADDAENKERWKALVNKHNISGENYFITDDNAFMKDFNVSNQGLPYFLIVGKDGKVLGKNLEPGDGVLTIYSLVQARENRNVKQSIDNMMRQSKRIKKHDDDETRQFVAFLEKYAGK
ncbi:TlpA family protein disulfide reductase [Chitinophaga sp. GCM10012297]|uniref:TlpA family protein disulfide reductase n=1 Tax=Chitinophaga chungangae TaxID=2821488 RepID=A0ABS3Y9G2_9BACT|nr:TlpA disulfide reductase family protein [Chitinophaga chungangae]MBO9151320.1 TlpA family protein disulfide reductase [Chitinophaga chungangae]